MAVSSWRLFSGLREVCRWMSKRSRVVYNGLLTHNMHFMLQGDRYKNPSYGISFRVEDVLSKLNRYGTITDKELLSFDINAILLGDWDVVHDLCTLSMRSDMDTGGVRIELHSYVSSLYASGVCYSLLNGGNWNTLGRNSRMYADNIRKLLDPYFSKVGMLKQGELCIIGMTDEGFPYIKTTSDIRLVERSEYIENYTNNGDLVGTAVLGILECLKSTNLEYDDIYILSNNPTICRYKVFGDYCILVLCEAGDRGE